MCGTCFWCVCCASSIPEMLSKVSHKGSAQTTTHSHHFIVTLYALISVRMCESCPLEKFWFPHERSGTWNGWGCLRTFPLFTLASRVWLPLKSPHHSCPDRRVMNRHPLRTHDLIAAAWHDTYNMSLLLAFIPSQLVTCHSSRLISVLSGIYP